jgi:hypothetical protein
MSFFSVTTVRPVFENGFGWLTCGVELIVTERLPCATAQAASVTDWFITTEPVRALITTFADGVARATSRFSMSARNATRASVDAGMRTCTTRPSRACAVPLPIRSLIERTTSRAVLKSLVLRSSCRNSPWLSGVGTLRSTVAPSGIRPALSD